MKKFLFLTLVFGALVSTTSNAQTTNTQAAGTQAASDQATMLQKAKETQVPQLVEKVGLTKEQANRIVEINFEIRQAAGGLRDLNEADRATKLAELKAAKEKKYLEVLTPEQVKSLYAFYEEMGKNREQKKAGS